MEDLIELLFFLFILGSSLIGTFLQKKKKQQEDQEDTPVPPAKVPQQKTKRQVPPLTPTAREPMQQRAPVWGELPKKTQEAHLEEKSRVEQWEEQRERERRYREHVPEPELRPSSSEGTTLEDVFRELFGMEEPKKATPPPVSPVRKVKKAVQKKVERVVDRVQEKRPSDLPAQVSHYVKHSLPAEPRPLNSVLMRILREGEKDPLRAGVIFSEIYKRPQPVSPVVVIPRD